MKKWVTAVGAVGVVALAAWGVVSLQSGGSGPAVQTADPTLRLITQTQYVNTIGRIFGPDIAFKVRFPGVQRTDGLRALGNSTAVLTAGAVDAFDAAARAITPQVVNEVHRPFLLPCQPADAKAADDQCARQFFTDVGRLLYRRPLTNSELDTLVKSARMATLPQKSEKYGEVKAAGDFYAGLAYTLNGMLVSPQFLYIWEATEADPSNKGAYRLDSFSKASRLSFLLWNAAPDKELLAAAERGDLHKSAGLRRQVDRMLASPLYKQGVRAFFTDLYELEKFDNLEKDGATYPAFTPKVVDESREQILRTVVDELVTRQSDYRDLYTTRRTFLSADLSVLYRIPVDLGALGWTPYEFKEGDKRAGLLTQIGFLGVYSHPVRSSPTLRGKAIRENLMCIKVPEPPPDVDFTAFENPKNPAKTARLRLDAHHKLPACAGCHLVMDPVGLALENFDAAGQYRTTENGEPISANGELDGVKYDDAIGFAKALHDSPALKSCILKQTYAYSVGRKVTAAETPLLASYEAELDKKGYKFDEILRLIVLDESFFSVKAPQAAVAAVEPVNAISHP